MHDSDEQKYTAKNTEKHLFLRFVCLSFDVTHAQCYYEEEKEEEEEEEKEEDEEKKKNEKDYFEKDFHLSIKYINLTNCPDSNSACLLRRNLMQIVILQIPKSQVIQNSPLSLIAGTGTAPSTSSTRRRKNTAKSATNVFPPIMEL